MGHLPPSQSECLTTFLIKFINYTDTDIYTYIYIYVCMCIYIYI